MLPENAERIGSMLTDSDLVLDVGGWAKPFARANHVIDLMPYETRGLYGAGVDPAAERFGPDTWVQRDICDREPWPYENGQFEFAICSHTLEDLRDPLWVCGELNRVAHAGYIEVPSRLEEQCWGVAGEFVGWSHHHWLIDVAPQRLEFVFKPHVLHSDPAYYLPREVGSVLTDEERVQSLFWEGPFSYRERIFRELDEFREYFGGFVDEHRAALLRRIAPRPPLSRLATLARRLVPGSGRA
jgi:hypothetical protein